MKKIYYEITESVVSVNENKTELTYGVKCLEDEKEIKRIDDMSPNKPAVEKFVNKLNKNGVDPIHLEEIAEDEMDGLI